MTVVVDAQLKTVVERIERLEEDKKNVADDIRDVYQEAKGNGLDVKALRTVVRLRKKAKADREQEEQLIDLYMSRLGG